jgi:predicted amidohydrolase YtcJ
VRAYSTWAAYATFVEDRTGVLTPGTWADITVLDVDPFHAPPEELLDGSVVLTVVAGNVASR